MKGDEFRFLTCLAFSCFVASRTNIVFGVIAYAFALAVTDL